MATAKDPIVRRSRWGTFSLRGLFIVVTLVCVWMAKYTTGVHRQRRTVRGVEQLGGYMVFDYGPDVQGQAVQIDNLTLQQNAVVPSAVMRGRVPSWLRKAVGEEYFRDVRLVNLGRRSPQPDDLRFLRDLRDLRGLFLFANRSVDNQRPGLRRGSDDA